MIEKIKHYSLTNEASVYDEESMTALELAGRTAQKVNEVIEEVEKVPEYVAKDVNDHIKKGDFDEAIGKYINNIEARVDNLVSSIPEGGTTLDAELIDIRVGADGKTYQNAGKAVRDQLNNKVGTEEFYKIEYETGSLGITVSGWDYSDEFAKNSRVRIKEGHQLKLSAGDVIGLRDYSDARMYLGFKVGNVYTYESWRQSDYTVKSECECVILIAHAEDISRNTPEDPRILGSLLFVKKYNSTVGMANRSNENIENVLNVDLNIVLGGMSLDGVYGTRNRYVTRDILTLPFDVVLKHSDRNRMAVYEYPYGAGDDPIDKGWVTDKGDYVILAYTPFRVMIMSESYDAEAKLDIDLDKQYESDLYKSIRIEAIGGKGINLMRSAKTLARIACIKTISMNKRNVAPRQIRAINHRGYNYEATENTLAAFKLSKKNGFDFVECDVRFSFDGQPVLFHDDTVDRISNGTGRVHLLTLSELQALDLGGEKIATFHAFIALCATLQLHPYIEIEPHGDKPMSNDQITTLVNIVKTYGMISNVTWISFRIEDLLKIVGCDPFARVGLLVEADDTNTRARLQNIAGIQTGYNEAFINIAYENPSLDSYIEQCRAMNVPVEVWTLNYTTDADLDVIINHPYISGVTSDKDDIGKLIINKLCGIKDEPDTPTQSINFRVQFSHLVETRTYECVDGMTWLEFVDSEYNVDGFIATYMGDGNMYIYTSENDIIVDEHYNNVDGSDLIIADHDYIVNH